MQAALPRQALLPRPEQTRPWTTYVLMLAIVGAMIAEVLIWSQGLDPTAFLKSFGLVSSEFSWTDPQSYLVLVTFNFLHSGARHFAGNAFIMLFAGAAVERYAGRKATLAIWLVGGVFSGLAHLLIFPTASQALVGASGAISALLGAAIVLGWKWALPVKFWRGRRALFHIRLPVVCGLWVAMQAYNAIRLYSGTIANPTVATWVHLTGFAFGVAAAMALIVYRLNSFPAVPQPHALGASGD